MILIEKIKGLFKYENKWRTAREISEELDANLFTTIPILINNRNLFETKMDRVPIMRNVRVFKLTQEEEVED